MSREQPFHLTEINGLKTAIYPVKNLPAVKIQLIFNAGSAYEIGQNWGAFHLIEHHCFNGTKLFPTSLDLELFKEEYGLRNNAFTGNHRVGFWVYGPQGSLSPAITLLNELVFKPTFPESSLSKEFSVIAQEYHDKWDSPYSRFGHAMENQIYGTDHPNTRDGIGQPEFIKTIPTSTLKQLHRQYFTAQNAILTLTGDVGIEASLDLLQKYLTPLKGERYQPARVAIQPRKKRLEHLEPVQQSRPVILWPTLGFLEFSLTDRLKFWIASYLLGGSARSLLFQALREKHGLVYRVNTNRSFQPHSGFFEVWASTKPENTNQVFSLMRQVTYDFLNHPIPQKSFKRALNYLSSNIELSYDSIGSISDHITLDYFWENQIRLPKEEIKLLNQINEAEVRSLASQFINPEKEFTALLKSKD